MKTTAATFPSQKRRDLFVSRHFKDSTKIGFAPAQAGQEIPEQRFRLAGCADGDTLPLNVIDLLDRAVTAHQDRECLGVESNDAPQFDEWRRTGERAAPVQRIRGDVGLDDRS